jgi:hypothetical protein
VNEMLSQSLGLQLGINFNVSARVGCLNLVITEVIDNCLGSCFDIGSRFHVLGHDFSIPLFFSHIAFIYLFKNQLL